MKIINPNFIRLSAPQFIRKMPFKLVNLLILSLFIFSSCKKEFVSESPKVNNQESSVPEIKNYQEGEIVLGEKLDNPYTVENMKKAYDKLNSQNNNGKLNAETLEIKTTHLYIRWLPKSWAEYDELKNDRKLLLYDIPLDYEVKVNGNKYHDKSIPEDLPTWQYTVIEKDYKFNKKIKYEILAEAYIPENDTELQKKGGRLSAGFSTDELINEALTLTNNTKYLIPLNSKKGRVSNWRPAGKVTVYDTRLGRAIGVQGVYVRARRFLSIESGVTNASGDYVAGGTFGGGADYALYWEAPDFDVRSGGLGQAWVNGPYLASDWNPHFSSGVDRFYAHVFRGAWRYHYGNVDGLCRPGRVPNFMPGLTGLIPITTAAIKYAAYDSQGSAQGINYGNWSVFGTNPNIGVWRYDTYPFEYDSDEIFSTTIHETAHTTHMRLMSLPQFMQLSVKMRESWAVGLEWYITQKEYKERGITNYADPNYDANVGHPALFGCQDWWTNLDQEYTPLYIDILDNHNQSIFGFGTAGGLGSVNDNVAAFNINTLEVSIVKNTYGLSSLSNNLKLYKPSNVSDAQIDQLISQY